MAKYSPNCEKTLQIAKKFQMIDSEEISKKLLNF